MLPAFAEENAKGNIHKLSRVHDSKMISIATFIISLTIHNHTNNRNYMTNNIESNNSEQWLILGATFV